MNWKFKIAGCLLLVATFIPIDRAYALLGESRDTISADFNALKAVRRSTVSQEGYSVEEALSDATTVREYVSTSGVVFAIAWNGYVHADLEQLLGSYWSTYSVARQNTARKHGRKRQQVTTDAVVVETWGHMRDLRGRAYVPSMIPTGVNIDEIK